MGAAGVPQAYHHRIMLPKIPRKTDERDGHTRPVDERAAHFEAVVGAAIIDEDNLVTAGDREFLERTNQLGDGARPVVDWDHDRQCGSRWHGPPGRRIRFNHE